MHRHVSDKDSAGLLVEETPIAVILFAAVISNYVLGSVQLRAVTWVYLEVSDDCSSCGRVKINFQVL